MGHCFLHEVQKSGFHSKNILFPIRQILTADFVRVSIVCAVARLTKTTKRLVSSGNRLYLACDIGISREI